MQGHAKDGISLVQSKEGLPEDTNIKKRQVKKELLDVFRKFGYLPATSDCEIKIKITSGNIAWININSIEIIK